MTAGDTGIDVLDCRFPIDTSRETEPCYAKVIADWRQHSSAFVADERVRRAFQAGVQSAVAANGGERRFVQAEVDTVVLGVVEAPGPYRELAPEELAHEWDTQPGRVIHWTELED